MNAHVTPPIGHNKPPSAFEETTQRIQDLFEEAQNWLDGEPLTTPEQHDKLVELVAKLRKARTEADKARIEENKPFDDGKKAVQAKFNPFIQKDKGKVDLAIATANEVLAPYLAKKAKEKEEAEQKARAEATEKNRLAVAAMESSRGDLEAREKAEVLTKQAKIAERVANKIDRTNVAKGARTIVDVTITNMKEAGRIAWTADPDAFHALTLEVGKRVVRESGTRDLPGFSITERKVV